MCTESKKNATCFGGGGNTLRFPAIFGCINTPCMLDFDHAQFSVQSQTCTMIYKTRPYQSLPMSLPSFLWLLECFWRYCLVCVQWRWYSVRSRYMLTHRIQSNRRMHSMCILLAMRCRFYRTKFGISWQARCDSKRQRRVEFGLCST